MKLLNGIYNKFINGWFWFNLYYKHTKEHKKDMRKVTEEVLRRRKEILGF